MADSVTAAKADDDRVTCRTCGRRDAETGDVCKFTGRPVTVDSLRRCKYYYKAEGEAERRRHLNNG